MEKGTRQYDLSRVKLLLQCGNRVVTTRAKTDAVECGYVSDEEIVKVVLTVKESEFYKSMTRDGNSRIWQDVYKIKRSHPLKQDVEQGLYVKLQINESQNGVVISFKQDTDVIGR